MTKVVGIELFAGAGGIAIGARQAGVDVRVAVELDPIACATLRENDVHASTAIVEADVTTLAGAALGRLAGLERGDRVIVMGGPPCQPFSKAAYWMDDGGEARYRRARARGERGSKPASRPASRADPRRGLVSEIWRVASELEADAFLIENVPSLLHPRHRAEIDAVISAAEEGGYRTILIRANAAEFGVPQRRVRIFLLAARDGTPAPPEPTHHLGTTGPSVGRQPAMTAGAALARYLGDEYREAGELVNGRWASHFRSIPPGWNYKFHTAWADHPDPTFVTEARFWNFLLKLHPDLPAWTIAANPGPWTGPFHWRNRRLRSVEMAALQGFPEDYQFVGNRRERVRQIGNAVPPLLATVMIRQVMQAIGSTSAASAA